MSHSVGLVFCYMSINVSYVPNFYYFFQSNSRIPGGDFVLHDLATEDGRRSSMAGQVALGTREVHGLLVDQHSVYQ